MLKLAWRNLVHERLQIAVSIGGVALAIVLMLLMDGIFAGSEEHAVIYIRRQPVSLWLMQSGVENMHMSSSILPPETLDHVRAVPGVAAAVGVLYANVGIEIGDAVVFSYVFGVAPDAPFGGPWSLVAGSADPAANEIVLDRVLAERYGLGVGDTVRVMGFDLTIAGLTEGTFGMATSVSFANKQAMALLMGVSPQAASYILIQPEPTEDVNTLAATVRQAVPDANLLTQDAFATSDQEMIRQMGADVIQLMNIIAYIIGLLVVGITIYTATLERTREYGVLKAIGASRRQLLEVVFSQSFVAVGLGYIVGVALAYVLALVIGKVVPEMLVLIAPTRWVGQIPTLVLVTVLAALLPVERILRVDPLVVFKA
ncbi:MAG: FtsX-like permease family protein [Anaerolineae bacterium]|nr:FtsX-like permease family protein [Anaerolineae bacterium]